MSGVEVAAVVTSIIAAFSSGIDIFRRVRGKPRTKNANNTEPAYEEELQLSRSLKRGPHQIRREYEQDLLSLGDRFASGDVVAQASLADTLLKLNTGLVNIISSFLSSDRDAVQLDLRSLTSLSESSRADTINTLGQLSRRLSQSSVILRSITNGCGRCGRYGSMDHDECIRTESQLGSKEAHRGNRKKKKRRVAARTLPINATGGPLPSLIKAAAAVNKAQAPSSTMVRKGAWVRPKKIPMTPSGSSFVSTSPTSTFSTISSTSTRSTASTALTTPMSSLASTPRALSPRDLSPKRPFPAGRIQAPQKSVLPTPINRNHMENVVTRRSSSPVRPVAVRPASPRASSYPIPPKKSILPKPIPASSVPPFYANISLSSISPISIPIRKKPCLPTPVPAPLAPIHANSNPTIFPEVVKTHRTPSPSPIPSLSIPSLSPAPLPPPPVPPKPSNLSLSIPRRQAKETPSVFSFASDSTKLGEIPEHKWATPAYFTAIEAKYPSINAVPVSSVPMFGQEEVVGGAKEKKVGGRFMRLFRRVPPFDAVAI
ncbi:MAG: hypothetical protein M1827_000859 [Pycnora praestabilis]|nr:MAG: hypothetical protein M1827_000859 [Pycnora praestabilis]